MTALHTLSVVIGATLQGGFGATITSSKNQLMQLGQAIKQLEGSSKSISTFQTLQRDTLLAKKGWVDAEAQVKSLAQQMAQATIPSKELQRSFEHSQNAALKAKNAYQQKRESLHQLGTQLRQSGQDMGSLVQQQGSLGASLEKLKYHYTTLDNLMQRRQGVLARRAQLRGELMDAVALGAALVAPIKVAMDFEKALNSVRRSVGIQNPEALRQLGETFKVMSRTIPVSAEGLAQIAASGGKLGITAQNLGVFTKSVATMSTVFNVPAEDMGKTMAKLATLYQWNTGQMTQVGDALQHLSRKMLVKPDELIQSLMRIGSAATQCGLSAIQVSALSSALITLCKDPEKAGSGLQLFLARLTTASNNKAFHKAFREMGLSIKTFTKTLSKDPQQAILLFLEAVSKVKGPKQTWLLGELFGKRLQETIATMVGGLGTVKKALAMVAHESQYAGTSQQALLNRSQTTAANLILFKNVLTELGINLGTVLLPPLTQVLKSLNAVLGVVSDMMVRFPTVTKVIMGATAALMGMKVAAIAGGYAWTFVQGAGLAVATAWHGLLATLALVKTGFLAVNGAAVVTRASVAFGGVIHTLGAAFTGLASRVFPAVIAGWHMVTAAFAAHPIGALVVGLALAATLVIANWSKVQAFFKTIWEPIKPIWEAFKQWVGSFWASISAPFKAIGSLWGKMWGNSKPESVAPSPQLKRTQEALKQPLTVGTQKSTTTNNHHQNITIQVQAAPHHDTKRIADEVMQRFKAHNRGALFDPVGGIA